MSADERKDLPAVGATNFLERVREVLSTYLGNRGDLLDRGVTLRDLTDSGVIDLSSSYVASRRGAPVSGVGTAVEPVYDVDLTPPPTPTGFNASAAISNLMITCDSPLYFSGHGHLRSVLYGATWVSGALPMFASAIELTEFNGSVGSYPTNPSTTWRLWLKWQSVDGVLSVLPAGGINGIEATTGLDLATIMLALRSDPEYSGDMLQRTREVRDVAESELRSLLGINQARLNSASTVAIASSELTSNFTAGISAEAALRTTLAAKVDTNQTSALALISSEAASRVSADSAEAALRTTLATQFRGTYEGSDVAAVTSGLIYQESFARASADTSLATQITLLSAGSGEQFDHQTIWYFDTTIQSWTGNGTPTFATGGYLRPANAASGAYVDSPAGIGAVAATYNQVKARIHKTGSPTFAGFLWWRGAGDATWDAARRVALTEPAYDGNGMGVVSVIATWTGTVDRIRIDLSNAQAAGTCYEIDWIAIGRPSPGASAAQILTEQQARVDGDGVVAGTVTTLSSQVNDATTGLPAAHAAVSAEATTRASQTGDIYAKYSVKIDTNGYVSGFDLISTGNVTATPYSDFRIRADKFSIGSPSGPGLTPVTPFVVYTSDTTINGVPIPAGIYMDAAYIANGTIINAKIGNAAIDDAKIANLSAAKITAGSIAVGEYIQSANYVAGTSGWRIHGDGTGEFQAAVVRGTVYATDGSFSGTVTIKDTAGNIVMQSGASVAASTWLGNVTGTVGGTAASTLISNASNALTNAGLAQSAANAANTAITNIGLDSILSPGEKPAVKLQYDTIIAEQTGIDAQATAYSITTAKTAYDTAVTALTTYLGTLTGWNTIPGSDVVIVGATFRTKFQDVYAARQALLTKIDGVAGTLAVWATVSGTGRPADNATVGAAFGTNISGQITSGNISTYIASAAIGNAQIGGSIYSDNYVAGSAGWQITKAGAAEFNTGTFRGAVNVGAYTGYAWPAAGGTGAHLSSLGLLLGNATVSTGNPLGKYFQVYTPPGGEPNIQTNIPAFISTLNIAGNAVTVPVGVTGHGSMPSASITLAQAGKIMVMVTANVGGSGSATSWSLAASCNGVSGPVMSMSLNGGYAGSTVAFASFDLAAGTHTVSGIANTGSAGLYTTAIFAIGTMR